MDDHKAPSDHHSDTDLSQAQSAQEISANAPANDESPDADAPANDASTDADAPSNDAKPTETPKDDPKSPTELIFPLDSKPPFTVSAIAALQHILAMILSVMAPPAIVASALGLPPATIAYMISMSLFFAGIGIWFQVKRPFGIGSGMLSIQATSFVFPSTLISLGTMLLNDKGMSSDQMMATLFGACFVGGILVMICSRLIKYLKKVITNTVSGVTVIMIGLSLIPLGADKMGGGPAAHAAGTFGDPLDLLLGAIVFFIILIFNRAKNKFLRMSAIMLGIAAGFLIALPMGKVDWSILNQPIHWFEYPRPFSFGFFGFDIEVMLTLSFLFVVAVIEAIGDLTATSVVSEQPTEGKLFESRLMGGVLCDGLITSIGAVFGCFPAATFSQNNGVIQLSGVASRRVGAFCGFIFLIFALFPFIVILFQLLPEPVLGGALLILFGSIACSGIRILAQQKIDRREALVIASSLGIGVMAMTTPDAFAALPGPVKVFFSSPIVAGGVSAMIIHKLLSIGAHRKTA